MALLKLIFGTAGFNPEAAFKNPTEISQVFQALKKEGIKNLDTARLYGPSEGLIGETAGHEDFVIDSKIPGGFYPGTATKDQVVKDIEDSIAKSKIDKFDILYIHAPETSIPFEETLAGINEAYKKGYFQRFGVSNFTPEQVQQAYDVAKSKGWVLPTVYQGNYSAVARKIENNLFPLLRKLGIAFYAYSPIAGGFLAKNKQQIVDGEGRFSEQAIGGLYAKMYNKPSYLAALDEWQKAADQEGIAKAELAYRWIAHHSQINPDLGDAVIIGASSLKQLEQTTQGIKKGALSKDAVKTIEHLWTTIESDAPVDNFDTLGKK